MEITQDSIINGLLEEVKRLTLENVALRAIINKKAEESPKPADD